MLCLGGCASAYPPYMAVLSFPRPTGQSACVDVTTVAVGWVNGSIVNPTLMPSSLGCEKHAAQATWLKLISHLLMKFVKVGFNQCI